MRIFFKPIQTLTSPVSSFCIRPFFSSSKDCFFSFKFSNLLSTVERISAICFCSSSGGLINLIE